MGMGYSGALEFNGLTDPTAVIRVPGMGGSMAKAPPRLEAGGAFFRKGLWKPRVYDWIKYEGSVEFELTPESWEYLKQLLIDRRESFELKIRATDGTESEFMDTYWTSISVSASEGSLITVSMSCVAPLDGTLTSIADIDEFKTNYINNREGDVSEIYDGAECEHLFEDEREIIPYWDTQVGDLEVTDWSLSINQDIVFEQLCEVQGEPVAPLVLFGIATAEITYTTPGGVPPDQFIDSLDLTIQEDVFSLGTLELNSLSNDLAGIDAIAQGNSTYAIYEMEIGD